MRRRAATRRRGSPYRPQYFWGAHAYALTPAGAAALLELTPVDGPVDVFMARAVHEKKLVAHAVRAKLAKQRTAATSQIVHTDRDNPNVVFDAKKIVAFDHAPDLTKRLC